MSYLDDKIVAINELISSIADIEKELGYDPQGPYASIRTRFDILEARIGNNLNPYPSTTNPFLIGNSGVSIQAGIGDPNILKVPAVFGSLYLREDGYNIQGLYAFRSDGYWHQIDTDPFTASGDLSGNSYSQTIVSLQGNPVNLPILTNAQDGYALEWNGTEFIASMLSSSAVPSGPAGGDLSGTYPNPTVSALQGNPVSNIAPTPGQFLQWSGTNWTPGAGIDSTYSCLSNVAVGDAIYISGSNTVSQAQANSSNTIPVIGFVSSKPTTTSAVVMFYGELSVFSGLIAGANYYLSSSVAGGISTTIPNTNGQVVQLVGVAKNANTLLIDIDRSIIYL